MARANYSTFAARKGATLKCDADGKEIAKGERYIWWLPYFRARTRRVRCMAHPPKQSELTSSKMSGVYAAQEDATANLEGMKGTPGEISDLEAELESAAETINGVAEEYRDAGEASPTGLVFGEDLSEKADEIESAASELESWSADEEEPDFDQCDSDAHEEGADGETTAEADTPKVPLERGSEDCESCVEIKIAWWDEQVDSAISAINDLSV